MRAIGHPSGRSAVSFCSTPPFTRSCEPSTLTLSTSRICVSSDALELDFLAVKAS